MVSTNNGEKNGGIEESNNGKVGSRVALHISTSQRGLISDEDSQNNFQNNFSALHNRLRFFKIGNLSSPSAKFYQNAQERDDISRAVHPSRLPIREPDSKLFPRKLQWNDFWKT